MRSKTIVWLFAILIILIAVYTVSTYTNYKSNASSKNTSEDTSTNVSIEDADSVEDKNSNKVNNQESDNSVIESSDETTTLASDFTLIDFNGKTVSLSDYIGKNVYVNFWATWCPPCNSEMPELESLYQETKDSDLVILSIDIGESKSTVSDFMGKKGYNFTALLDEDMSIANKYGINSIPTSIFINKEGNIVYSQLGAMSIDEMKAAIAKLD